MGHNGHFFALTRCCLAPWGSGPDNPRVAALVDRSYRRDLGCLGSLDPCLRDDIMRNTSRRQFLRSLGFLAGAALLSRYRADNRFRRRRSKTKIRDIKVMMLQGPRTYTLVKIESDAGLHGIGEAYGSPGVGVKEGILALKPELIGKDPLGIDVLMNRPRIDALTVAGPHADPSGQRYRDRTLGPRGQALWACPRQLYSAVSFATACACTTIPPRAI